MSKGIIFNQEFGYVAFPYLNEEIRVKLNDIKLAIFEVHHFDKPVQFNNGIQLSNMEPLRTYSFLYAFDSLDTDKGYLWIYRQIDGKAAGRKIENKSKLIGNFVDTVNKVESRDGFKMIYFGQRNEG
jgi:hypothetical protein